VIYKSFDLNRPPHWSFVLCRFVLKTDDDAFVNMFSLVVRLHSISVSNVSSSTMLILCNAWRNELVARQGKWRIDTSLWRYDYWPTFCQGLAFIMTRNFVTSAHRLVHRVPRLWVDDVSAIIITIINK